jgi:hypothetical protein
VVDIFDEIEEELRAEKAQRLLKRYAGLILTVAILIIAVVGAWQGWRWYQARQDVRAATEYIATITALDAAGPNAAGRQATLSGFEHVAAESPEGYRILARLHAAALKADAGDIPGAAALWDQVAGDSAADPLLRDLASLMWASHQIDQGDPARVAARLKPLAEPGNAWRPMAREQLALLDLRQGHTEEARTALRKLSQDVTAPAGVRGRSAALLARMGG